MNRPLVLTGVALSAVVALTGCGGAQKAGTVGQSASPVPRHRAPGETGSPAATRAPSASATVKGTVRVGGYCKDAGTVGRTTTGTWARCQKRSGDARPRWYAESGSRGGVRSGEFCAQEGAKATSGQGEKLTCTKKRGEARPRWRKR